MTKTQKRIDGRRITELRPVSIKRGYLKNAEGSALIEMGGTRVLCAATVEERVPPFLRNTGRLHPVQGASRYCCGDIDGTNPSNSTPARADARLCYSSPCTHGPGS